MHWSEVWEGCGANARLARTALTPLSWLYAAGWQSYLALYRSGLKRPKEPHRYIVCVGNLQVGGSGKSPFCQFLAAELQALGKSVVLGCSGYGSPHSEGASIAPDGNLGASEWGDEPAMHRWLAPDLPLIVGRDRVEAARLCNERFPGAILLMDDGFQHLPLRTHLSIVLDPSSSNRCCLPAGPYREPWTNRTRADLVIPGSFTIGAGEVRFLRAADQSPITIITETRANLICALAKPKQFVEAVQASDVTLQDTILLPDHDPLTRGNLFESFDLAIPIVVTAKDWVKLRDRTDLGGRTVWVALRTVRAEPAEPFRAWLAERLDEFL